MQSRSFASGLLVNYTQLIPVHFGKVLLSIKVLSWSLFVECIMGNEHTFFDVLAYSRPSLGFCVLCLLEMVKNQSGVFISYTVLSSKIYLKIYMLRSMLHAAKRSDPNEIVDIRRGVLCTAVS